jgi:predicted RNase H-like HicB family nuclease
MGDETQVRTGMLSCLMGKDAETGLFLGHCLNFDLVTSGKTEDEAWQNLKTIIKAHFEYCYANYPDGLRMSATVDEWKNFAHRLETGGQSVVEKLEIELRPPLPEVEVPIWIQGVTGGTGTCTQV